MTLTETVARVYVNHGRLVADCPFCGGAEQVWDGTIRTHPDIPFPYGLTADRLACGFTGETCPAVYPPDIRLIWEALAKRPDAKNRNWFWSETVDDLWRENAAHGVA